MRKNKSMKLTQNLFPFLYIIFFNINLLKFKNRKQIYLKTSNSKGFKSLSKTLDKIKH